MVRFPFTRVLRRRAGTASLRRTSTPMPTNVACSFGFGFGAMVMVRLALSGGVALRRLTTEIGGGLDESNKRGSKAYRMGPRISSFSSLSAAVRERTKILGFRGHMELIMGPMFAGKTSELLRRIRMKKKAGHKVLVVKSAKDTRYDAQCVVSHDGDMIECAAVTDLKELPMETILAADVIAVDEGQFFNDLASFCTSIADGGKTVIVAGLDGDFKRERFGELLDLVPHADSISKLKANCAICGAPAPFTARRVKDDEQTLVGGAESYMPMCREHYKLYDQSILDDAEIQDPDVGKERNRTTAHQASSR